MKIFLILFIILSFIGCPNEDTPDKTDNQSNQKITSLQTLITNCPTDTTLDLTKYADWTITDLTANKTIAIEKALNINAGDIDLNNISLTVKADGVQLTNLNNAKVTADKSLGSGSLKIASSSLSSLDILGGGIHSIYILDVSVDTITVAKQNDSYRDDIVRLVYDESTDFGNIVANSDILLYYDGNNSSAQLDASKITIGSNVNVAANTAIRSGENTSVAAITLPNNSSMFVLANKNEKLNETLINQTIAFVTEDSDIYLQAAGTQIDFTQNVTNNSEYTIGRRDKFHISFDYGAENPFIIVNETQNKKTNFGITGNASPLYSDQISDKDGNIFFIHNSSLNGELKVICILYNDLYKLSNGDNNITIQEYLLVNEPTIINKQYIRFAIFEKGFTKHLFILQHQLHDKNDTLFYPANIICLDVCTKPKGSRKFFNQIGLATITSANEDSFAQSIAVDKFENIYVGYNLFTIYRNTQTEKIIIDYSNSIIDKYFFVPVWWIEGQSGYTPIELVRLKQWSYSQFTDTTLYNTNDTDLEDTSLYNILSNYTFGLEAIPDSIIK